MNNNIFNRYSFLINSLSISLNFFFSTILIILLSLLSYFDLAAEIGLTVSFTLFFCQIFSANHRSLIFLDTYQSKINSIIQFRFFISIFIILLSSIIILYLEFENTFFLILLAILICTQWISEIFLTVKEKDEKNKSLNTILLINIIYILIIILIIFFDLLNLINFLMPIIIFNYVFFFRNEFNQIKFNFKNLMLLTEILKLSIKNLEIISSFSINFANLIWRFSIFLLAGKTVAGLLFGSYAIGSFFGTVYSNILAPKIHSKKILFSKKWLILFIPLMLGLFYSALIYFENLESLSEDGLARIVCILFSLVGSFLMIFSLMLRFNYFYTVDTKFIFKLDIIYSLLISSIIIVIFYLFSAKFFVTAYLVASLCSLATYSLIYLRK